MNSAKISNSPRLQRVDQLLSDGKERTTMEIVLDARVMAVSACVSELREQGRVIHCQRRGDLWFYRRDFAAERKQRRVS